MKAVPAIVAFFILAVSPVLAELPVKEHPLVKPYIGSTPRVSSVTKFDRFAVPSGGKI